MGDLTLDVFFNDTATTEIYTLSLHDALPICDAEHDDLISPNWHAGIVPPRSEEHTSELQSLRHLVCRLLLEKKTRGPIRKPAKRAKDSFCKPISRYAYY